MRVVPHAAEEPLRRVVRRLPYALDALRADRLQASRPEGILYRLSLVAIGPRVRPVLKLPQGGSHLGVRTPELEGVRGLPQGAQRALRLVMRELPYREQALDFGDVHTSGDPG